MKMLFKLSLVLSFSDLQEQERKRQHVKGNSVLTRLKQSKQKRQQQVLMTTMANVNSRILRYSSFSTHACTHTHIYIYVHICMYTITLIALCFCLEKGMKKKQNLYARKEKEFARQSRISSEDYKRHIQKYERIQMQIKWAITINVNYLSIQGNTDNTEKHCARTLTSYIFLFIPLFCTLCRHFANADARLFEDMWLMNEVEVKTTSGEGFGHRLSDLQAAPWFGLDAASYSFFRPHWSHPTSETSP